MRKATLILVAGLLAGCVSQSERQAREFAAVEKQFHEVPMEARRYVQPLFWLHGDETKEQLELFIGKMAELGCGGFVAESRPHNDFLGEGWFRDLDICLAAAKKHDLKMWIFDEKWWPSQSVGGKVPEQYAAKQLVTKTIEVEGPAKVEEDDFGGERFVAAVAGKEVEGGIDGGSLVDLSGMIKGGKLVWEAPAGKWRVMRFTWKIGPGTSEGLTLDGASQDCVEWYIQTVYQPHYDRYKADFGKTIEGYFYDEPEVHGDWGTEVLGMLNARGVDWKKGLVAWKFNLAGEEQAAAKYQYQDALFEAWGRTLYGGLEKWCAERKVKSIGHFIEHGASYLKWGGVAPGNMFQMQKYSAMGGIDNVFNQFRIGQRTTGPDGPVFQTTKLGSSISHVYGKDRDVAFCEIFGADGQDLVYSNMKWQADQHQVRGINFMVPHSFNPRAPYDTDCPPYFWMGEFEPRYPLFKVWADYTNRLSEWLVGGRHVCAVATVVCGNSIYAGKAIIPDQITDMLDDIQMDSDWMPYDALAEASIDGKEVRIHQERYKVLIAPPAEVVPVETLAKIQAFFDAGGVVIGYGYLPVKSATVGKGEKEIGALREAIWGEGEIAPSTSVCKTSANKGRSYFLGAKPTQAELKQVLGDAGIKPAIEVLEGKTDNWLHVLHRVKDGRDVFFIANQNPAGEARRFVFRATAKGEPECWDAMRGEVNAISYKRINKETVEFGLTMEPCESALIVFQEKKTERPMRIEPGMQEARKAVAFVREKTEPEKRPQPKGAEKKLSLQDASWVWYPEGDPRVAAPPGTRYFRGKVELPGDRKVTKAVAMVAADNGATVFVNGKQVGQNGAWLVPSEMDVKEQLKAGENVVGIAATNGGTGPNPAGLIGAVVVEFDKGEPMVWRIDSSWKAANEEAAGWNGVGFDDSGWKAAKVVAKMGDAPWGNFGGSLTVSPIVADPFVGKCRVPLYVEVGKYRVYVEMDELPDRSASVKVNGVLAGGVIGKPCRVNVTELVKVGENTIEIRPVGPKGARLVFYGK